MMPASAKLTLKYVYVNCECGQHLVDIFDIVWDSRDLRFYECNSCERPLVAKDRNGNFYVVGDKI